MEQSPLLAKPLTNIVRTESFTNRYTTKYKTEENSYYYLHTNNLVIIGITKELLQKHKKIKNINFRLKEKYEKMDFANLVKGKKKKGGIPLSPDMKICDIEFEDGFVFLLRSRIKGKIIEINEKLLNKDFDGISKDVENNGFLFIVNLPSFEYSIFKDYQGFVKF